MFTVELNNHERLTIDDIINRLSSFQAPNIVLSNDDSIESTIDEAINLLNIEKNERVIGVYYH